VARGLCHLAEALQYVHYVKRRLHLGLSPDAVFISQEGVWKLGGFGFSLSLAPHESGPNASTVCPYYVGPIARKVINQEKKGGAAEGIEIGYVTDEIPINRVLINQSTKHNTTQAGGFRLEPPLSYTAPEITAVGTSHVSYTSDAFSLGCLLHDAFALPHLVGVADAGRPLLDLPDYATAGESGGQEQAG